jgi:DMSO reductase anchor subunit
MHPAFSVIFLTTLLGVGQGLFLALYTGQIYALANLLAPQEPSFYVGGSILSLGFLAAGLLASFFHLGRPERAWRTATMWRTSWLSREVIVLPATMALIAAYGLLFWLGWTRPLIVLTDTLALDATLIVGALATLATFALFLSTAMIYASVKFLQEWHSPLTVVNYTLLGGASGFTLAAAYSAWVGADLVAFYGTWAVILTLTGMITRIASLVRNHRLKAISNPQTAIGVRHTRIVQKAQGAMGGSFNTREFFHHRSPRALGVIRGFFLVMAFPVPVLLLAASYGMSSPTLPLVAFVIQYLGLMAERWYFFAEARHPQNLYYQAVA